MSAPVTTPDFLLTTDFVDEEGKPISGEVPDFASESKVVYKAGKQDFFSPVGLDKLTDEDINYAEACAHNRAFAERIGLTSPEDVACFNIIRFKNKDRVLFSVILPLNVTEKLGSEPIQVTGECPWLVHDEIATRFCHALKKP